MLASARIIDSILSEGVTTFHPRLFKSIAFSDITVIGDNTYIVPLIFAHFRIIHNLYTAKTVEWFDSICTKGKRYFENTQKFYSMDLGLRNAKLNFRQQEKSHLMENMIYLELIRRGYNVDVGVVEVTRVNEQGKKQQSQYEIDFIVNTGKEKIYIQSALNVDTKDKQSQETFSLKNSGDFFRKIVIVDGNTKQWMDEDGIMYVGVIPFLLEDAGLGF